MLKMCIMHWKKLHISLVIIKMHCALSCISKPVFCQESKLTRFFIFMEKTHL